MITGLNHITLCVTDIERSFVFYRDILQLRPLVKWDQGAYFLVGEHDQKTAGSGCWFCLNVDKKNTPTSAYTHYAFSVTADDFETMEQKIVASGTTIFKENSSPGKSLYFLDPDGHKLEIHVGTYQDRLAAKKKDPSGWQNVEWY